MLYTYLEYIRLQPLYCLLRNLLLKLWLHFLHYFFYVLLSHVPSKSWHLLTNLLLALAKLPINQTRKEALAGRNLGNYRAVFLSLLCSHLLAVLHCAASPGSSDSFEGQWALVGVLCLVSPLGTSMLLSLFSHLLSPGISCYRFNDL